ncbi:hypothetical protein COU62_03605 [Candidatus Pacearchaeota archaeon CG10_big_fil_rev_8_21_14_0_10_35_219]|nr:hypothetical protein [Candidatus Pacearchaeota archaeon]OIO42327.1 MAG: hypothetical protein AUJ63_03570 [Candidatus Pacearchaeota archaeon CG1_02_35_32]PIO07438.1 MAG: hypothetical protein COU62_03605 [Candidatus Pacearchaeota archaeon CG10_big_fil_rev_8_21_14_0_10_35_219]PIY81244.1 MAG: hypothetical protein COY79_03100 [Candidatus Pacearchaeota archaeon CG_4_10_14_0_8_um_filter_35_169]PIZ80173.1 MAG: hypothetical protein COY00_01745 [Candidatus Pacearchaeota archaeon CG_4_10_14_0_2_um_filt
MGRTENLARNNRVYKIVYGHHGDLLMVRDSFAQAMQGKMPAEMFELTMGQIGADILVVRNGLNNIATMGRDIAMYDTDERGNE